MAAVGRLLTRGIATSKSYGRLPTPAKLLFVMLVPHFDPHGKMEADPDMLKFKVCKYIPEIEREAMPTLLKSITKNTSMKWFKHDGEWYLHWLDFSSEQRIRKDRIPADTLPSYPQQAVGKRLAVDRRLPYPKSKSKAKENPKAKPKSKGDPSKTGNTREEHDGERFKKSLKELEKRVLRKPEPKLEQAVN